MHTLESKLTHFIGIAKANEQMQTLNSSELRLGEEGGEARPQAAGQITITVEELKHVRRDRIFGPRAVGLARMAEKDVTA